MDNNHNNYYDDPYNTTPRQTYEAPKQPTYYMPTQDYTTESTPQRRNIPALILSIVSLVCGILSVECSFIYGFGIFFAIPGLITRSIAVKKNNGVSGNMAKAGLITSIIGLVISILFWVVIGFIIAITISQGESVDWNFNTEYYY